MRLLVASLWLWFAAALLSGFSSSPAPGIDKDGDASQEQGPKTQDSVPRDAAGKSGKRSATGAGDQASQGQKALAENPPDLQMELRFASGANRFQIGELIPMEILLSSSTPNHYLEPCELFSERTFGFPICRFFSRWSFSVTPVEGRTEDTYDPRMGMRSGPMFKMPIRDLISSPTKFSYMLTKKFRFDQPGEYHVRLSIDIGLDEKPARVNGMDDWRNQQFVRIAREVVLEIVPASAEWEQEIIRKGLQAYRGPAFQETYPPSPEQLEYQQATQALCNLGTAEAARIFARLMSQGKDVRGCLERSRNIPAAIDEMQRLLVDPDAPVTFVAELVNLVSIDSYNRTGKREDNPKLLDETREALIRALPQKRGKARIQSLVTLLQNPVRSQGSMLEPYAQTFSPEIITTVISEYDRLPEWTQRWLLSDGWNEVRSPLMLPVVRRRAQEGEGPALLRWLELDPPQATAFIHQEIVRVAPRLSSYYLRLPEALLPDEELQIARNFVALKDPRALMFSASLLHRYATAKVLPQVLPFIDEHVAEWDCWIQFPVLAYLLKVAPEKAESRVNIAFEKAQSGGCAQWAFLTYLGALEPSPMLERLALAQIDQGSSFTADSAEYLKKYGSPAMKRALFERLERWTRNVPEAATKQARARGVDIHGLQSTTINELSVALVEAQAWVLTPEESSRLENLLGKDAVSRLKCTFNCAAPTVGIGPGTYGIYGQRGNAPAQTGAPAEYLYPVERLGYAVNQYRCPDLKSLKEKLLQFPPESTFTFAWGFDAGDEQEIVLINDFLLSHGYKVINPQNWPFLRTGEWQGQRCSSAPRRRAGYLA